MFTITALVPDPFTTNGSNHQIIVKHLRNLRPVSCLIGNGKILLEYRSGSNTTVEDQWDTGISVNALSEDAVLTISVKVDGVAQAVSNNPPTVTLRKSGGGGNTSSKVAKSKGKLVGSFQSSKKNLILVRYNR